MLELFLNVAWGLIAAATFVVWVRHKAALRQNGARILRIELCALCCALALLFPAISATDDLHAAQLALETSDQSHKFLKRINRINASAGGDWLHSLPALLLAVYAAFRHAAVRTCVVHFQFSAPAAGFFSNVEARAPPLLLAA